MTKTVKRFPPDHSRVEDNDRDRAIEEWEQFEKDIEEDQYDLSGLLMQ